MANLFGFLRLRGFFLTNVESYYRAMKRPYNQFIGFAGFKSFENLWCCIVKECNEVLIPKKAVNFLPVYTGNPVAIKIGTCHNGLFAFGGGLSVDLLQGWVFYEKGREPQQPAL